MANYQVSIKDSTSAQNWLSMVEAINEDYLVAMKEANQVLREVNNVAEGTIVDEMVDLGDKILTCGEQVFNGISKISETVTSIISTVSDVVDSAKNLFSGAVSAIFN